MDSLVAQYSRPAYSDEGQLEAEDEFTALSDLPQLSLKFALPEVDKVHRHYYSPIFHRTDLYYFSLHNGSAQ